MQELDKTGNTIFQKSIKKIITEKISSKEFNEEQIRAIKIIWGMSKNPNEQPSNVKAPTQTSLDQILKIPPIVKPILGKYPNKFKYEKEEISHSYQNFSASIIIGPPGTGKTTVIVNGSLLYISDPLYRKSIPRVFIGTPNNESADRVLESFSNFFQKNHIPNGTNYIKRVLPKKEIKLYSTSLKPFIIEKKRPKNYTEEEYKLMIGKAWIFIGTVYQLSTLSNKYNINPQIIIFDESSQLTPPMMYLPFKTPIRGFCLVGDNCQLSPITSYTELSINAIDFIIRKLHYGQQNLPSSRQVTLKLQYRMHPAIRDLSTKFAPGRHIITDWNDVKKDSYLLDKPSKYEGSFSNIIEKILNPEKTVVILDTSDLADSEDRRFGRSRYNEAEIKIIDGLFKLMKNHYDAIDWEEEECLKLISPYRTQADKLKKIYDYAGTADLFQGQEANIVIISLTLTEPINSPHIRDFNRLHVMFSRAKKKMIILGRKKTFEQPDIEADHIKDIFNYEYIPSAQNPELNYNPVSQITISKSFYELLSNL